LPPSSSTPSPTARTNSSPKPTTTQVDPNAKQSATNKFFRGLDPKQIPPYKDPALQARVDRIAATLIPAFQRALPDDDPTKIHFRFQVVDRDWKDAITMPSGVIVVPRTIVERLTNDSQLATVLADNIATAIEKQDYRAIPARNAIGAGQVATEVGAIFVPPLLIATVAEGIGGKAVIIRLTEEQSGRVSLSLLHDAGYDITQAPLTWWILSSKPNRDIADAAIPHRATYLYEFLSANWTGKASPPQPLSP
jgi:predicted Zn-dependent protease